VIRIEELRLGFIKTQELAEWFQISYSTFRKKKDQKIEELKLYAEFEEVYGGVNILKIIDDGNKKYTKESRRNYEIVKSSFDQEWSNNGIDSCANVAVKIYDKHKNELTITDKTTEKYALRARTELYGKPFVSVGELGSCSYLWCRREFDEKTNTIIYTEFTDEEQAIKKELMKKYFSTDVEKEVMVAEMVNSGEITKAEAYDVLCEMKNLNNRGFMAFKSELELQLGCSVVKATLLDRKDNKIEFLGDGNHEIK